MARITPFLWFNNQAEAARDFYVSVFPSPRVGATVRHGELRPGSTGAVMTGAFELDGQEVVALNGGPQLTFSPAASLVVNCDTQDEIDGYRQRLGAGGEPHVCGSLEDRHGVSWQVVPRALPRMLADTDALRVARVMESLMKMTKLELGELQRAFNQRWAAQRRWRPIGCRCGAGANRRRRSAKSDRPVAGTMRDPGCGIARKRQRNTRDACDGVRPASHGSDARASHASTRCRDGRQPDVTGRVL
jgi:predicted 3-demethylubiquinone-9 3-methyltransferase (glyoxalase superfamily)